MPSDCLPVTAIPHSSKLFIDFVQHFEKVSSFYTASAPQDLIERGYPQDRRRAVGEALERQNRQFGSGEKALENIRRLRAGAPVVVTGQQVALFGGPMFSLLKAVTAAHLAKQSGAVPVFWMATEDHDFAEVSFTNIPAGDRLERLAINSPHAEGAPVGRIRLGDQVKPLLQQLREKLGESVALDWLIESYRPEETLGFAFGKFLARICRDLGLVLLEPADPELHRVAATVYRDALQKHEILNEKLAARERELEAAGYHAQVKVTASHTLCFYVEDGIRTPVRAAGRGFAIGEKKVSGEDLLREAERCPERFNANVLLRPVVQDYLLPTLCYVGGPAEIAYFAQAEVVYRELLGRVTPVQPRLSATIVEPRQKKLLDRYRITLPDTFQGPEKLRELLAAHALPQNITRSFDSAAEHLEQALTEIREPLGSLDRTLRDAAENAGSKMRYQLQSLRDKAARAELRKNEETQHHADELSTMLYPNKDLQERQIGAVYFLLKYGQPLIAAIERALQETCPGHQVVELATQEMGSSESTAPQRR